jgi:hypothetical protein
MIRKYIIYVIHVEYSDYQTTSHVWGNGGTQEGTWQGHSKACKAWYGEEHNKATTRGTTKGAARGMTRGMTKGIMWAH